MCETNSLVLTGHPLVGCAHFTSLAVECVVHLLYTEKPVTPAVLTTTHL